MNAKKNKKLSLKLRVQTYQILKKDDEVCIPSLSSILLAVTLVLKTPPLGSREKVSKYDY